MAKYRRQPKAGDLARKPSAPFAIRPREFSANNFAAPIYRAPESENEPTVYPAEIRIIRYAAGPRKASSLSWQIKGGMSGGATGAGKGVCSCNGSGVVPQAFIR